MKEPLKKFNENNKIANLKEKENINNNLIFNKNKIKELKEINIKINLKYYAKESGFNKIFGKKFVVNNAKNIYLLIKENFYNLIDEFELEKGENNIQMIVKNPLTNLEYMFFGCNTLTNIEELKYLDTRNVTNFSHCFYLCSSLKDISSLKYWNKSNSLDCSYMFTICKSLSDLNSLKHWADTKCSNYSFMFFGCSLLKDLTPLKF